MNPLLQNANFDAWTGRLVRSLRRRHNDRCITILTYHSIAREPGLFTHGHGLCHAPAAFEREIEYLADNFNVIRLSQLIDMLERHETPRRAVVLTFDDGFADTLHCAMPICYRRRLPITIFPVTSVVGNTGLLWQHKLAWLMHEGLAPRVWDALAREGWDVGAREDLDDFVRRNFRADVPEILESVIRYFGVDSPALAARYRPYITPDDMADADPEFVEFGNHTDTHPVLSAISENQQMVEIGAAARKIMGWTGRPPVAFAYPFGLRPHYTEATRMLVRTSGHRAALDMRRRMNVGPVDPFELSRKPGACPTQTDFEKLVEDWPANTFGAPPELAP